MNNFIYQDMKHFIKNKILIFIALCIIPITIHAQFAGGNGTEANPYQIATAEHLAQLATYVNESNIIDYSNKHYILTADIDLSVYGGNYNEGKGWIPIGVIEENPGITHYIPFVGKFNGNNKIISNLYINDNSLDNVGLFGYVAEGPDGQPKIENLGIINVEITGNNNVGGIIGRMDAHNIKNCYCIGEINGNEYVGGMIGYEVIGSISNCSFVGSINGNYYTGGVVGKGDVNNCYSMGEVNGYSNVGGITGDGYVQNSFSTSEVNGNQFVGGISGEGGARKCIALNPSIDGITFIGRIVGYRNYNQALTNNIAWDGILNNLGNTNWNNVGSSNLDGENITASQINSDGTLGGRFTIANGWTIENGKLPGLFGEAVDIPEHIYMYLIPPVILTDILPDCNLQIPYNQDLIAESPTPVTWSLKYGSLPFGLSLAPDGKISGTPLMQGTYTFTVSASNTAGDSTKEFTIHARAVGIKTIDDNNITIYPNPTDNVIQIDSKELQITNIELFDISGKKCNTEINNTLPANGIIIVNISDLQSGIYFIRINTESGIVMKKVGKN